MSYNLSYVINGHTNDVRCVTSPLNNPDWIFSGSRDATARLWALEDPGTGTGWIQKTLFKGHTSYVTCLVYSSSDEQYKHGLLYTGCNDGKIRVYEPDRDEPLEVLEGHDACVTSLHLSSKTKTLISASWDCTAKVWINNKVVMTLKGHEACVWCAVIMPSLNLMLTGSGDSTIKVWKGMKCQTTLKGQHTQPVRDLALVGDDRFISCSNDGQVILWQVPEGGQGDPQVLFRHREQDYIYSVSSLPDGNVAACGENFGIKIFSGKDGQVIQTIPVPAMSVWALFAMGNGDIVAGTSENNIYIFTRDESRMASPDLVALHSAQIETFVRKALTNGSSGGSSGSSGGSGLPEMIGDVKTSEIPGPDFLQRPGKREGQTAMVRSGNTVSVHSWSASNQQWTKIGDVVGEPDKSGETPGPGGKTMFEGKEYDHVFHIDIDEGVVLKLPYNCTEEPYHSAQSFIHKHNLPQEYLDQVAQFIIKNSTRTNVNNSVGSACDPFTGSGAYVSGSGGHTGGGGGLDPFTGSGAYTTTGSSSTPMDTTPAPSSVSYYPQKEYLTFSNIPNFEALSKKLAECNSSIPESSRLDPAQLERVSAVGNSESIDPLDIPLLLKALRWPKVLSVNPALDVTRLVLLKPSCESVLGEANVGELVDLVISHVAEPKHPKNQMLALKVLVNLFKSSQRASQLLVKFSEVILQHISALLPTDNKVTQVSIATLVLNYAVSATSDQDDQKSSNKIQGECLNLTVLLLESLTDPEAKFRALVALGTVLSGGSPESRTLAKSLDLRERVQTLKLVGQNGDTKIADISSSLVNSF